MAKMRQGGDKMRKCERNRKEKENGSSKGKIWAKEVKIRAERMRKK
jgi:hypothetical protein